MEKVKVGILGIGAIGSVMVCHLAKQPNVELFLFNRTPKNRIQLKTPHHSFDLKITTHSNQVEKIELDWLIICLKEYHYKNAKHWFPKLISPSTKIAIIRNGILLDVPLLPFAKASQILACMIDCPTQPQSNGQFLQLRKAIITTPKTNLSSEFKILFPKEEITFQQVEDFKTESWKKLLESSCIGAITCLTGETCWVFKDEKIKHLYINLLKEGINVAKADGVKISNNFTQSLISKMNQYPPQKGSSMLTDRKLGRPIELGAKSGAIVLLGQKYQIKTPLHELVVTLLNQTNASDN